MDPQTDIINNSSIIIDPFTTDNVNDTKKEDLDIDKMHIIEEVIDYCIECEDEEATDYFLCPDCSEYYPLCENCLDDFVCYCSSDQGSNENSSEQEQ